MTKEPLMGAYFIPESWAPVIERYAADHLERDILRMMAPMFTTPTEAQKLKARAIRERIVSEGKLMEVLEATMGDPNPNKEDNPTTGGWYD